MHRIQNDDEAETEAPFEPSKPPNGVIVKVGRSIPPLYKYCHPERVDVLRSQMIRFSSPAVLNDPFELRPHVAALASPAHINAMFEQMVEQKTDEELAKLPEQIRAVISREALLALMRAQVSSLHEMAEAVLPAMRNAMTQGLEAIGILCLTESPENLLMWAHYADSHRGFVIEFDPAVSFFDRRLSSEDELRHLRRVAYRDERPSIVIADVESFAPFLTKGTDWHYEAEWRIMDGVHLATKTMGIGPEAIHLFAFPGTAIRSIVFGCRTPETTRAAIREIVTANPEYSHVVCKQATIDETRYRVLIVE